MQNTPGAFSRSGAASCQFIKTRLWTAPALARPLLSMKFKPGSPTTTSPIYGFVSPSAKWLSVYIITSRAYASHTLRSLEQHFSAVDQLPLQIDCRATDSL
jgi:hypothetical protein